MTAPFEIVGGAGEAEAAAIAAVITRVLLDEAEVRAVPPRQPRPSSWVVACRPRETPGPLSSHTYESPGRTKIDSAEVDPEEQ